MARIRIISDEFWAPGRAAAAGDAQIHPARTSESPAAAGSRSTPALLRGDCLRSSQRAHLGNALPREKFGGLGSSAVHKRFQEWAGADFSGDGRKGLAEYDDLGGIVRRQSSTGTNNKAPLARESVGPNPTDRGKKGTKRHVLADGRGVPLSIVVTGANVHDSKEIDALLAAKVGAAAAWSLGGEGVIENPCLDAAWTQARAISAADIFRTLARETKRLVEIKRNPEFKARRWVVEANHSWTNRFRKIDKR